MAKASSKNSLLSPLTIAILAGGVLLALLLLVVLYQPQQEDVGARAIIPQGYDCRLDVCRCQCFRIDGGVSDTFEGAGAEWASCVKTTAELDQDAREACQLSCEANAPDYCDDVGALIPFPSPGPSRTPRPYTCERTGSCNLPTTSPAS